MSNQELFVKKLSQSAFLVIKKMLLDKDTIQKINFFENVTKTKVKDFLERENKLIFIIDEGDLKKILDTNGKNVKKVENMMHKKLKVIEFSKDPLRFTKSYIYPIKPVGITLNNEVIEIKVEDRKSKGLLIGRESKNLNELNTLVKRYYNLQVKIA